MQEYCDIKILLKNNLKNDAEIIVKESIKKKSSFNGKLNFMKIAQE